MKFKFDYIVGEHGWADACFYDGDSKYEIYDISYLSDAFRSLSESILQILKGLDDASCAFDHEPGRTRILMQAEGDQVRLTFFQFKKELVNEDWNKGNMNFQIVTRKKRLKSKYLDVADKILKEYGIEEYKIRWRHNFPTEIYEQIKSS